MPDATATRDYEITSTIPVFICESHCGMWAKIVRTSLDMTTRELADKAGVSPEDVDALENSTLKSPDTRQKILQVLWAARSTGQVV